MWLTPLHRWPWAGFALLASSPAFAQDAARGALLYLQLPGGAASCVECHGPDPLGNRNRLLNAAGGPAFITEAISKAAAMGYLRTVLSEADRADLSAYLARVNAQEGANAAVWPSTVEFGRVAQGAAVPESRVAYTHLGPGTVSVQPRLVGAEGLSLRHDCPAALPPGGTCTATLSLATGEAGARRGAVLWEGGGAALPQWVGVAGQVLAAPAAGLGVLVVDLAGAELSLEAPAGSTAERSFALVNAGTGALILGTPALTGPGAAAFSLAGSGCAAAAVLAPGARCTVRLSATAPGTVLAGGQAQAQLQWRSDGTHPAPLRLALRATAAGAPPSPAPAPPPAAPTAAPPAATPPPAPAAPAPPPTAAPPAAPAPSPGGAAPSAADVGGGGGCATELEPGRVDPVLPALLLGAWLALRRRPQRCREALTELSRHFHRADLA